MDNKGKIIWIITMVVLLIALLINKQVRTFDFDYEGRVNNDEHVVIGLDASLNNKDIKDNPIYILGNNIDIQGYLAFYDAENGSNAVIFVQTHNGLDKVGELYFLKKKNIKIDLFDGRLIHARRSNN